MTISDGGRRLVACAAVAAAAGAGAGPASAELILDPGVYRLGDHPDGGAAPPAYGLRLDELIDVTDDHDVFTFSFDHPQSAVFLEITELPLAGNGTAFGIHIFGSAFGGQIVDNDYDALLSGVADLDFTYMLVQQAAGDDDFIVTTPNFTNTGTISFRGSTIDLFDRANDEGFTFRLGDEDNDGGHRGFAGVSGWGWLDHGTAGDHVYSSDWLFTIVPTPGTALLGSISIALFAGGGQRRKRE